MRKRLAFFTSFFMFWSAQSPASDNSPTTAAADTSAASASGQQTIQLGSLKFTFGPQSSGDFGATLKGGVSKKLATIKDSGCYDTFALRDLQCNDWFAETTFNIDSAWSSSAGGSPQSQNKNDAAISVQPEIFYEYTREYSKVDEDEATKHMALCSKAISAAQQTGHDVNAVEQNNPDCLYVAPPLYDHFFALAANPDVEYRYGYFTQSGTSYKANQLVTGAGVKLLYPAKIGGNFASWPYLSASYDAVKNYGTSNLPLPSGIQNHFLDLGQQVEFYIPKFESITGQYGLLLVDFTESRPVGGTGTSRWQAARTVQLIIGTGGSLKPALTFRSGQKEGLTYDRQIIFGVLWDIFGQSKGAKPTQ